MLARHLLSAFTALSASVGLGLADGGQPLPVPRDSLPASLDPESTPLGLARRPARKDSAPSAAIVRLGRKLFFDPILSRDSTVACASCHRPEHGFTSGRARSPGIDGRLSRRRAPALFNRAYGKSFFWDGRESTLEDQALKPIEDPNEMGARVGDVVERLKANPPYRTAFDMAFADGVSGANLGRALAAFERVLLRGDSRVDRFRVQADHAALTAAERHGLWLYESKARCWRCHGGANFTDEDFHNTGVSWGKTPLDFGRFEVTRRAADRGKFKTPTLRGVALTAPYMHDGSLATLEDVVDFYNRGGGANPHRDPLLTTLGLSAEESRSLVAFLKAL